MPRVESSSGRRAVAVLVAVISVAGMVLVVSMYGIDSAAAVASLVAAAVAMGAALLRWSAGTTPTTVSAPVGDVTPREEQPVTPSRQPRVRWWGITGGLSALLILVLLAIWEPAFLGGRNAQGGRPTGSSAVAQSAHNIAIDKTAWYGGYRVMFGIATYDPAADPALTVALKVENLGRADRSLYELDLPIWVAFGGRTWRGEFSGPTDTVGGGSTIDVTVAFEVEGPVPDLASGILTVGEDDALPAKVPIGSNGDLVALEPVKVLSDAATRVTSLQFNHLSCDLRGDDMVDLSQVRKGNIAIGCTFDVSYHGTEIDIGIFGENVRLVMPNGDLRAPVRAPSEVVGRDQEKRGVQVVFVVPWPAPGSYALRLLDRGRYAGEVISSADVLLAMPNPDLSGSPPASLAVPSHNA